VSGRLLAMLSPELVALVLSIVVVAAIVVLVRQ
jgi:hypothetical protein